MPAPHFSSKDKLTFSLQTLREVPAGVPILFAMAALIAGYLSSAYSVWVSGLFAKRGEGIYCVQNCSGAYEAWYRNNVEAAKYAGITHQITILSFPVAMTLATIFAMSLGWLPNVRIRRLLPGLGLLYCGVVATALLAMLSFALSMSIISLPLGLTFGQLAAATYFYSPALARAIMTGRDPSFRGESGRVFLALLLSLPLGVIIGVVLHGLLPTFILTYGIPVALGAFFGASLALPVVSPQLLPAPPRVLPNERRLIERLALALGAQIAVGAITLFQHASRPLSSGDSGPHLLAPFILTQLPFIILICLLLSSHFHVPDCDAGLRHHRDVLQPCRRAFLPPDLSGSSDRTHVAGLFRIDLHHCGRTGVYGNSENWTQAHPLVCDTRHGRIILLLHFHPASYAASQDVGGPIVGGATR